MAKNRYAIIYFWCDHLSLFLNVVTYRKQMDYLSKLYSLCLTNAKCIRLVTYNTSALSIIRVKENSAYIEKSIRIRIKTIQVCGNKVFVLSTDNQIICYSFHENKKRTAIYYKENILELNHHHQVSALKSFKFEIWISKFSFVG